MVKLLAISCCVYVGFFSPALAFDFCIRPSPPPLTDIETAKEFAPEFSAEFEQYFLDARKYLTCIQKDHSRVLIELNEASERYGRFVDDSQAWVAHGE